MSAADAEFWQSLPLGRDVSVLTVDENGLGALAKPAGVLSHPNESADEPRSLLQAGYARDGEYFHWLTPGGEKRLWLLNRLDSATSGVILVCADAELADLLKLHFRQKRVHKVYNALVFGRPATPMQIWRDRLAVQRQGGHIRTSAQGHIPAECRMSMLRARGGHALLRLEPVTGRSHQLRVQCARRGLPIVGDATYGDFARNREFARRTKHKRMFLHSLETAFEYDYRGQSCHFSAKAPLPSEFDAAL